MLPTGDKTKLVSSGNWDTWQFQACNNENRMGGFGEGKFLARKNAAQIESIFLCRFCQRFSKLMISYRIRKILPAGRKENLILFLLVNCGQAGYRDERPMLESDRGF